MTGILLLKKKERLSMKLGPINKNLIKEIQKNVSKKDVVLEIGAGNGDFTMYLAQKAKSVLATDIQDVFEIEKMPKNTKFVLANGEKLPFENQFDKVFLIDVIEHVKNDKKLIEQCLKALKKDGELFIETPNIDRLANKVSFKKPTFPRVYEKNEKLGDIVHLREYTLKELENLVAKLKPRKYLVKGFWFGLRTPVGELGVFKYPKFLEKYTQCWIARVKK